MATKETGHQSKNLTQPPKLPQAGIQDLEAPVAAPVGLAEGVWDQGGLPEEHSQAARLADTRLDALQRQTLARQIGSRQGNTHLQRVIAQARAAAPSPSNGNGHRATAPSRRELPASQSDSDQGLEADGLGQAGPPVFTPPPPPPNGNGGDSLHTLQRQEDGEDDDRPSPEERAAALALAQQAESQAARSKQESAQETAQAQSQKKKEAQAKQSAEGKRQSSKAATPARKKRKRKAPETGLTGKNGKEEGQEAAGPPTDRAPSSPAEDPAFAVVVKKVEVTGKKKRVHAPAGKKAAEAQAAAVSPPAEAESQAQSQQVEGLEAVPTPAFDAAGFKAQLMQRIDALLPNTAEEADDFKKSNNLGSVKSEMSGKAKSESQASIGPLEEASAAPPDTAAVTPRQAAPLAPPKPGQAPAAMHAQGAAPKPKFPQEVEQPFQERSADLDAQMSEEDVTDEQLARSNEPEFQAALDAKNTAQQDAARAPVEYRAFEGETLGQARAQAENDAVSEVQSMHGKRAGIFEQVAGQQQSAKTKDEAERARIAADIQGIYNRTQSKVEKILSGLDSEVETTFDRGAAAAQRSFEDFIERRTEAWKQDRYGGWFGWARWLKDKWKTHPMINRIAREARNFFRAEMSAVIDQVVAIIARRLTEARAEIAQGKQEIRKYVNALPENLQQVGQEAAAGMEERFAELEYSIEDKQSELIDTLANKYVENVNQVETKIQEFKDANAGLYDKAKEFIKKVINTLRRLKDLLVSVLSAAVSAIKQIIKDPIGFLSNLITGIKQGFNAFVAKIKDYLVEGLVKWMTGAMAGADITIPEDLFSLEGIFSLVTQVLGFSWEYIRGKAVKLMGEPVVQALETGFEVFQILINEGPLGLWRLVKEEFTDLKETVLDAIQDMIITEVIEAGVKWVLGLFNPAGALVKAAMMIVDVVSFFLERGEELLQILQAIVESITALASGSVSALAAKIESVLAKAVPFMIGLLASVLGLGDLPQKIMKLIKRIRRRVDKAIDGLLLRAKKAARGIIAKSRRKDEKEIPGAAPPGQPVDEKQAVVNSAVSEVELLMAAQEATVETVEARLPVIKRKYNLKSLSLVADETSHYHVEAILNPKGESESHVLFTRQQIKNIKEHALVISAQIRARAQQAEFLADPIGYLRNPNRVEVGKHVEVAGFDVVAKESPDLTVLRNIALRFADNQGDFIGGQQAEIDFMVLGDNSVEELISAKFSPDQYHGPGDYRGKLRHYVEIPVGSTQQLVKYLFQNFGHAPVYNRAAEAIVTYNEGGSHMEVPLVSFRSSYLRRTPVETITVKPLTPAQEAGQEIPGGYTLKATDQQLLVFVAEEVKKLL